MRASDEADHPEHVLTRGKHRAVRGAALYGANAAGKSNLVLAMGFARDLIVRGRGLNRSIGVRPFALRKGDNRPSGFHWQFIHDGQLWSYGFDVTSRHIVEEYLFSRDENGDEEKMWFERKTDENGETKVEFGPGLVARGNSRLSLRLELIAENLRANQLFLTHAMENKVEEMEKVWEWFNEYFYVVHAESTYRDILKVAVQGEDFLKFAGELLRFADTGIIELIAEKKPFDLEEAENDFSHVDFFDLEAECATLEHGEMRQFDSGLVPKAVLRDENGDLWSLTFQALHRTSDGETHKIPFEHESEGTQRLLHLSPILFVLRRRAFTIVADELDRRLHTLLAREFVKLALDESSQGQLIFTTHDTNLLDADLLRRDEIWFVDKGKSGASSLYSLAQFEMDKDVDYEKAYLLGLFEGRPYFKFSPLLRGIDAPPVEGPTLGELRGQLRDLNLAEAA